MNCNVTQVNLAHNDIIIGVYIASFLNSCLPGLQLRNLHFTNSSIQLNIHCRPIPSHAGAGVHAGSLLARPSISAESLLAWVPY